MPAIEVYDPPLCCSTGVCGPDVDPVLVRFAADLQWLKEKGVEVKRYNLAQQPEKFATNDLVKGAMTLAGELCLPLIVVGGSIVSRNSYPDREALASLLGLELS